MGKMKGFHSLNTSPLDNMFCEAMSKNPKSICYNCYSRKSLRTYAQSARRPWKLNGRILSSKVLNSSELPKTSKEYFRFQSHGELINENHYVNLVNIAKKNPNTTFALWTKRKNIVKKFGKMGADNLVLIYSEPMINNTSKEIPEEFDRRFTVFTKDFAKDHNININCHGKSCMDCLECYSGEEKYINEIIK